MKEQPEIIQKICGESGHSKVFITLEHDILVCFCSWIYPFIKEDAGNKVTQTIILGWLKSKEVLIGVFGEELVCKSDGYHMRRRQDDIIDRCIYCEQPNSIFQWRYHHNHMGYTVEECLEYYGRELG